RSIIFCIFGDQQSIFSLQVALAQQASISFASARVIDILGRLLIQPAQRSLRAVRSPVPSTAISFWHLASSFLRSTCWSPWVRICTMAAQKSSLHDSCLGSASAHMDAASSSLIVSELGWVPSDQPTVGQNRTVKNIGSTIRFSIPRL